MRYIKYLIIAGLLLSFIFIGYMAWLNFKPYHFFTIKNVGVETSTVKAGEDLIYTVDYCKTSEIPAQVSRTLVGPDLVPTPAVSTITKIGCRVARIHLNIPSTVTPGTYHLDVVAVFSPIPNKNVIVKFSTPDFTVDN